MFIRRSAEGMRKECTSFMCVRLACIEVDSRSQNKQCASKEPSSSSEERGLSETKSSGASSSSSFDLRTWLCALGCLGHLSSSLPESGVRTRVSNISREIGGNDAMRRLRL